MTETNTPQALPQTGLKFGAFAGLGSFLMFVGVSLANYNPLGQSSWLSIWILPFCMILGLREYKSYPFLRPFTYKKAFWCAFNIYLSSSLLFLAMVYIYGSVDGENLVRLQQIEVVNATAQMQTVLGPIAVKEMNMSADHINLNSVISALFFQRMIGGIIAGLIIAIFFKEKGNSHYTSKFDE